MGSILDPKPPTKAANDAAYEPKGAGAAAAANKVDKATLKVATKKATLASGAQGSTSGFGPNFSTSGTGTLRWPVRIPVKTSRYRFRIRNYNSVSQTAGTVATGKGINFGVSNTSASAYETGQFAGSTSTPVVASDFTIPGDGTFYTSPWVTDPAQQITPNREYMVAMAFSADPAIAIARGTGTAFWFPDNITTGLNSNNTPTKLSATPFEFQLEYEYEGDQRIGLFVGDSITEGVGGKYDEATPGDAQPTYRSWPALWAARSHSVAVDIAISGTTAAQWATPTQDRWTRLDIATTVPDFAYIGFGSNDVNATTSLATFKTNLKTVIDNVRAKIGDDKPIYVGTITPRNFETVTKEPLRLSYNVWLRTMPYGIAGVLDFDKVLRDPANPGTVLTEFFNSDNTHPSRAGYNAMALSVPHLAGQ